MAGWHFSLGKLQFTIWHSPSAPLLKSAGQRVFSFKLVIGGQLFFVGSQGCCVVLSSGSVVGLADGHDWVAGSHAGIEMVNWLSGVGTCCCAATCCCCCGGGSKAYLMVI